MAGTGSQGDGRAPNGEGGDAGDCCFVWDGSSKLYYHASSGFYHDPEAGWYYSSTDGIYYRFERGRYLPWESDEKGEDCQLATAEEIQATPENRGCYMNDGPVGSSPPSEWLEETLINLYLKGYSTEKVNVGCSSTLETDDCTVDVPDALDISVEKDARQGDHDHEKVNEDDRGISEDMVEHVESNVNMLNEGISTYEQNWLAQYGQVVKSEDEDILPFPVVDLWDWRSVREAGMKTKVVSRLVGRLVKWSTKLHPSMPAGGSILKTAPICEVHLDLVRVTTGKIYRLKSPSMGYLSLLSNYDSSNPTKDWDFPRLNIELSSPCSGPEKCPDEGSSIILRKKDSSANSCRSDSTFGRHSNERYRDRAAERRALYGTFGIGPENGISSNDSSEMEGINIPFGSQSYGRRLLERMGWKEGEALGRSDNGLLQPLRVVGNKDHAGLGWSTERTTM